MTQTTTTQPARRPLGATGPETSAVGLGLMGMSGAYGRADDAESLATIHAAVDAGITLLDSGDFYGMGHNELLLGRALRELDRDQVQVSVKFGAMRGPDGSFGGVDTRPAAMRNFLAYSLVRLGTDHVDVYRPARLDPQVPIEETVGGIAEMVEAGHVRHIGLSEVGSETLRRAHAVHPITDLQIEYSVLSRGIEGDILDTCRELGIAVTAYGVLSRGLLGGAGPTGDASDFRNHAPRFLGDNLTHNLSLVERLRPVAERHGISVPQLGIAWVVAKGDDIVPLVGTRKASRVHEALEAASVRLTEGDLTEIEAALPASEVAGTRSDERQMAALDSER
jgi:aryl-alcohol dehydrogenase-like predicted oxidoreductase